MLKDPTSPTPTQMSFLEDSRVNLSQAPDSKKPNPTPDTSGQKCLDLSKSVGRLGLLEKTLLESSNWAWTKYSLTWKTKATPQGRLIFQLARSAPRTSGKGSGLLHTPTAKGNQMAPSMLKHKGNWWPTPQSADYKNMDTAKQKMLSSEVKMWPTPRVSDTEGGVVKNVEMNNGSFSRRNKKGERWGVKLKDAVNHTDPTSGGSLNPQWVAWLMGYPTEYLKSVPWETQSSRKSQRK